MVIVEYCKHGNLSNYLKSKRALFLLNKVRNLGVGGFFKTAVSFRLGCSSIKQEKLFFHCQLKNVTSHPSSSARIES